MRAHVVISFWFDIVGSPVTLHQPKEISLLHLGFPLHLFQLKETVPPAPDRRSSCPARTVQAIFTLSPPHLFRA